MCTFCVKMQWLPHIINLGCKQNLEGARGNYRGTLDQCSKPLNHIGPCDELVNCPGVYTAFTCMQLFCLRNEGKHWNPKYPTILQVWKSDPAVATGWLLHLTLRLSDDVKALLSLCHFYYLTCFLHPLLFTAPKDPSCGAVPVSCSILSKEVMLPFLTAATQNPGERLLKHSL